ncbi:MAG TPA: MarR family transcriptional regulator [Actinomycetota bacterium]|nr:MarR family transcriptional regulator [Actinomycetota bacterium]
MADAEGQESPDQLGGSLGMAGQIEHIARHFDRVRSRALAGEGLSPRDVEVLNALGQAGSPYRLSQGDLARASQLTSGGMTSQADRMEEAGWVARSRDPDDRRGVLVSLTETGRQILERSLKTYLSGAEASFGGLGPADQRALQRILTKLVAAIEGEGSSGA